MTTLPEHEAARRCITYWSERDQDEARRVLREFTGGFLTKAEARAIAVETGLEQPTLFEFAGANNDHDH